jgi:hypothetical protein
LNLFTVLFLLNFRRFLEEKLPADPTWSPPDIGSPLVYDKKHEYMPFHLIPGIPNPPDCRGNAYNVDESKRIGMVGRKIGMAPQW